MAGSLLDPGDVGVDRKDGLAVGLVADRGGRVGPDAGQRRQVVRPALRRDDLRRPVEADRAPVVPEPLPLSDHLAGRGRRERGRRRPALEPGEPARDHALDLRLLQHHLARRGSRTDPSSPARADRGRYWLNQACSSSSTSTSLDGEEAGAIAGRPPDSLACDVTRSPSSSIRSSRTSRRNLRRSRPDPRGSPRRAVPRRPARARPPAGRCPSRSKRTASRRAASAVAAQIAATDERRRQQHEQHLRVGLAGSFHVDHLLPFLAVRGCGRTRASRARRRAAAAARRRAVKSTVSSFCS